MATAANAGPTDEVPGTESWPARSEAGQDPRPPGGPTTTAEPTTHGSDADVAGHERDSDGDGGDRQGGQRAPHGGLPSPMPRPPAAPMPHSAADGAGSARPV